MSQGFSFGGHGIKQSFGGFGKPDEKRHQTRASKLPADDNSVKELKDDVKNVLFKQIEMSKMEIESLQKRIEEKDEYIELLKHMYKIVNSAALGNSNDSSAAPEKKSEKSYSIFS